MGGSNEIGARIKELREKHGMTQTKLAEMLFTSRETVNMWERGSRDIKTGMIIALADALQTSCDYILRGIETNNIDISEDLGLSNTAINHLRALREAAELGEWPEQDELHAIDFLLSTSYCTILEDLYSYFDTDFSQPFILNDTDSENEDDNWEKNDRYAVAFKQRTSHLHELGRDPFIVMEVEEDVYENAYLTRITDRMKRMKFYNGDIPPSMKGGR